jgi:replicative DNA helicase
MISQTKEMPHSFEAEQALLGAILFDNKAYHQVSEFLRPEHFADPMHGKLYESAANVIKRGQSVSPFTLKTYVDSVPGLKDAGGSAYIARLAGQSVFVRSAESFGREVVDAALRRGLIGAATELMTNAYSPDASETSGDLIERHERRIYDLSTGHTDGGFETFARSLTGSMQQAEAAHKRQGQLSGVPTGLTALDGLLGGLHRSDLIILAGRPSMGKTALATNIAFSAAKAHRTEPGTDGKPVTIDGARVGFFSLEMSAEQLANRILAEHCGISSSRIRRGELTGREMDRLIEAAGEIGSLPLYIDDTAALSITALRTRARRLQRQHGLDLIVVDYLQLIAPDSKRNGFNRVNEVTEITTGLKAMAKELDVPVLALSQLSRAVENRQDKRPQLADLRESGSIEQDADVVMFVYREEYYLERDKAKANGPEHIQAMGRGDVLVEKQRHGPIGTVTLKFEAGLTRFSDLA